ncbi:tetratricopeptide repeat protein [Pseudotenacibaculum haliotis]|uniref:Tetratricopeptide repeat protein n=1 Tax=Pseudotenacibaculum haliotis TaxID=1862138 RepID=A0ABW5LNX5_9FLAO
MEEQNSFDHKVKRIIKSVERDKLIQEFKDYENTIGPEIERKSYWKYWMSAAAILLLSFIVYFMNSDKTMSTEEIYDTHFSMYKNTVVPIIRNGDLKGLSLTERAFTYYELKKYDQALVAFDSLTRTSSIDTEAINLYQANIYLHNNLPERALSLLDAISLDHEKRDQVLWYRGLTYLKLNKVQKARKSFQKLKGSSTYRKEQVLRILESLSKVSSKEENNQ